MQECIIVLLVMDMAVFLLNFFLSESVVSISFLSTPLYPPTPPVPPVL